MSQDVKAKNSPVRRGASEIGKYRKALILLGLIVVAVSVFIALLTSEWLWVSLSIIGICFALAGIALQVRDLANHLKTRDRKNDLIMARVGEIEKNLKAITSASTNFSSQIAQELTDIKKISADIVEGSKKNSEIMLINNQSDKSTVSSRFTELLDSSSSGRSIIRRYLTAKPGKKTLFIGKEKHCNFVNDLLEDVPELDVDTVNIDSPDTKVVTSIGEYCRLLIWLPESKELASIIPFSWISDSQKTEVIMGPAHRVKMADIERLNYGIPVTLVVEKELENLLAVKVVRSLED